MQHSSQQVPSIVPAYSTAPSFRHEQLFRAICFATLASSILLILFGSARLTPFFLWSLNIPSPMLRTMTNQEVNNLPQVFVSLSQLGTGLILGIGSVLCLMHNSSGQGIIKIGGGIFICIQVIASIFAEVMLVGQYSNSMLGGDTIWLWAITWGSLYLVLLVQPVLVWTAAWIHD